MRDRLGERGSSTVELALVLPLLLSALVGAVQFAIVDHAQNVVATAATEGARVAASDGNTLDDGIARTSQVLDAGLGRTGRAFAVTASDDGETTFMQTHGDYALFIPWVTTLAVPINATAMVRKEEFRSGP